VEIVAPVVDLGDDRVNDIAGLHFEGCSLACWKMCMFLLEFEAGCAQGGVLMLDAKSTREGGKQVICTEEKR